MVVKEHISGPLSMDDTMFILDDSRRDNCVTVRVPGEDGGWTSAGEILNQAPEWYAAGHGLYSTPRDYIRFERALLRGGELDGERILEEFTVERRSPISSAISRSRGRSRRRTRRLPTRCTPDPGGAGNYG